MKIRMRKTFIKSMKELIKRYEMALKQGTSKKEIEKQHKWACLLCSPMGVKYNHTYYVHQGYCFSEACKKLGCPWIVMTGMTCDDWSYEYVSKFRSLYLSDDPQTINNRIDQIKEWIEYYENNTESPEKGE